MADLEACGEDRGGTAIDLMRHWIQPRCHRDPIPAAALGSQRGLFELELEILWPIMAATAFPRDREGACEVLKTKWCE